MRKEHQLHHRGRQPERPRLQRNDIVLKTRDQGIDRSHHDPGVDINRMLRLVGQMGAAILHLGDTGTGVSGGLWVMPLLV